MPGIQGVCPSPPLPPFTTWFFLLQLRLLTVPPRRLDWARSQPPSPLKCLGGALLPAPSLGEGKEVVVTPCAGKYGVGEGPELMSRYRQGQDICAWCRKGFKYPEAARAHPQHPTASLTQHLSPLHTLPTPKPHQPPP